MVPIVGISSGLNDSEPQDEDISGFSLYIKHSE